MSSRVEVIINGAAGGDDRGERVGEQVAEVFESCGVRARLRVAGEGGELVELARRASEGDAAVVVAGGGDGTVSAVAAKLVGTDKALGVLPLGTLNHFAKDLGIPLALEEAVRNVCRGRVTRVDVGEVNGQVFVNNSSLGLYPHIVRRRERQQARLGRGKWHALFWAALTVLRRYPFLAVRLSTDEREIVRRTPFVFVGNNEYQMESFQIGSRSCLDAGRLSLYVTRRVGRLSLLWLIVRAVFGRLTGAKDFDAMCASEILVETRRPRLLRVATDGEVTVMRTPLHYRVLPGALQVIVPRTTDDGR